MRSYLREVKLVVVADTLMGLIADCSADKPSPDASDIYFMHLLPVHSFMAVKDATPTRLVLQTMDPKWFGNYVKAHPDELAMVSIGHEDDIVISASTDDVQKFLIRHEKDEGVFGDEAIFVRPGDPTTRPSATTDPAPASGPPKSQLRWTQVIWPGFGFCHPCHWF